MVKSPMFAGRAGSDISFKRTDVSWLGFLDVIYKAKMTQ